MLRLFVALSCIFALSLTAPTPSAAKTKTELYGEGVHQYHTGDYQSALDNFDAAARMGSQDPRVYYFRAVTHMQLGNDTQANADLEKGAWLEAADLTKEFPINKSLLRVQGDMRVKIEQYRAAGKKKYRAKQSSDYRTRYTELEVNEDRVLARPALDKKREQFSDPFADEPGDVLPRPKGQ